MLPAHCHPYTKFLWLLALPSLHPSTFLENVFSLKEDIVLASLFQNPTNKASDHNSHCYRSGMEMGGGVGKGLPTTTIEAGRGLEPSKIPELE